MTDANEVTIEQFERMAGLLQESCACQERAKSINLTLDQKVAFQRRAKQLRDQAMAIGK